jgi:uncharacterized protein YkwD
MATPRRIAAMLVFAFALAAAPAALAAPNGAAGTLSTLDRSVLVEINSMRAQHHLSRLRVNARLTTAARAHSEQMAADGYFAHESSDGSAFWKRLQTFYSSSSWHSWAVGENLLWSSPSIDSHGALELWLKSPEHRRNLLDPRWREVGVSAVHVSGAPGVFGGRDVTIVTTDFGVRS